MNIGTQSIRIVCARAKFVPLLSIRKTVHGFTAVTYNLYRCVVGCEDTVVVVDSVARVIPFRCDTMATQRALPQSKEALLKSYTTRLKDDVKSMLENFEGTSQTCS